MTHHSIGTQRIDEFLDALASKTPAPGGGAVTGSVGAIAIALARMVVSYSVGSKKLAEHRPALEAGAQRLDTMRTTMLELADADAQAYGRYSEILALPEGAPGRAGLDDAASAVIDVPMRVLAACEDMMALYKDLAGISNRMLRSDLAIAAILTEATARASVQNVVINLPLIEGTEREAAVRAASDAHLAACARRLPQIIEACA